MSARATTTGQPRFEEIYDQWFEHVARWLRALGAPSADSEDLAQEVFLVVRRRLHAFDGRNLAGWLYRIADRQVAAHRRRRWFKSVVSKRPAVVLEELPDAALGPAATVERREKERLLESLIAKMSDTRRATFVLFEIEGYSGDEIARMQRIPVATVWTRLHHARKEFFALVEEHRRVEEGEQRGRA
ncbi:MAG TPA: RNA polymerase sigma factor [Polyangia bacterium]|nr:RNA polymerase sigma factor [Polyangia bacterium]